MPQFLQATWAANPAWGLATISAEGFTGFTMMGAIASGSITGFSMAYVASGGHLRAGFEGAISGGAFGAAGQIGGEGWDFSRVGAHAVAGCVSSSVGGGDCGTGALSAVAAKVTTIATGGDLVGTILAGGVGSVVGGGKFANGALTATYGYLFNWCQNNDCLNIDGMKMETQLYPQAVVDKDFAVCIQGGPCIAVGPLTVGAAPEKLARQIALQIKKDLGPGARRVFHDMERLTDRTVQQLKDHAAELYEEAGKALPRWIDKLNR